MEKDGNSTTQLAILSATSRLLVLFALGFIMQNSSTDSAPQAKEITMTAHAKGTLEVKLLPLPTNEPSEGSRLRRMSIDKQIHGDLEAVSKGEMR